MDYTKKRDIDSQIDLLSAGDLDNSFDELNILDHTKPSNPKK